MEFARGPKARTEGYSISGSQAKSVALNCGGTLRGGKRLSVSGPIRAASWPAARQTRDAMNRSVRASRRGAGRLQDSRGAKCFTLMGTMNRFSSAFKLTCKSTEADLEHDLATLRESRVRRPLSATRLERGGH